MSLNGLLAGLPIAPVALAALAAERGWGVLHAIDVPVGVAAAGSVLLLDGLVYLQHRLLHAVPALWAFHRVHHADLECDYTTGLRFHPLEALVTNAVFLAAVALLGLPALGVAAYQALARVLTLVEHANARLPGSLSSRLGRVLVTPAMHRIHHSADAADSDGNFGTVFSLWDRWAGTYRARPARGADVAVFGLEEFRDPKYLTLPWTLLLPFLSTGRAAAVSVADRR